MVYALSAVNGRHIVAVTDDVVVKRSVLKRGVSVKLKSEIDLYSIGVLLAERPYLVYITRNILFLDTVGEIKIGVAVV